MIPSLVSLREELDMDLALADLGLSFLLSGEERLAERMKTREGEEMLGVTVSKTATGHFAWGGNLRSHRWRRRCTQKPCEQHWQPIVCADLNDNDDTAQNLNNLLACWPANGASWILCPTEPTSFFWNEGM